MAKFKKPSTSKRTKNGKRPKASLIRSKNRIKKTPRTKRVAKPVKKLYRRDETPRRKAKRTAIRSHSAKPQGTARTVRTTVRLQKLAPKEKSNLKNRRSQSRQYSEPAPKTKRGTGYRNQHLIKKSKTNYFERDTTLKISESTLAKKSQIKLSSSRSKSKEVLKALGKKASQKFKALGKSKDNLRLVKLQYTYTFRGKKRKAYFSKRIVKITNEAEMQKQIEKTILEFEKRLSNYTEQGFSNISISGLRVHAYEE